MPQVMKACALALLICLCVLPFVFTPAHSAPPENAQSAARDPLPSGARLAQHTLFPELDHLDITDISLLTPSTSFHFRRKGAQQISVNGQHADPDVFNTLLSQIMELPVCALPSFYAAQAPVLTLVITTPGREYTARFYADDTREEARIVSAAGGAPQYRITDAWRIGMLMMTCEGTRIQDERGNETPAR